MLEILLPPVVYAALMVALTGDFLSYTSSYRIHAAAYFLSFLLIPAAILKARGEKLANPTPKSFAFGIAAYAAVTPIMLKFANRIGASSFGDLPFVAANVATVDFYVFRVVQQRFGFTAGVLCWVIVHVPELLYLSKFDAPLAFFLIAATAFLMPAVYSKTRDFVGLAAGHVALNVILLAAKL